MARPNLLFSCFGLGPGTVPFRREEGSTWDLALALWHRGMIDDHASGRLETVADRVFYDPDRTKRKFRVFAELVRDGKIDVTKYDAVALADDDLEPVGCTWSDVFSLFHHAQLAIAQPALTEDSYRAAWAVTYEDPSCLYRETDFVEVMIPIVKTGPTLERLLPYLLEEKNGLGIERLMTQRFSPIGILDATPIRHARPIGSAHNVSGLEENPFEEMRGFCRRHGLDLTARSPKVIRKVPRGAGMSGIRALATGG